MSDTRFSHVHYSLFDPLNPRKAVFIAHRVTFLTDQQLLMQNIAPETVAQLSEEL